MGSSRLPLPIPFDNHQYSSVIPAPVFASWVTGILFVIPVILFPFLLLWGFSIVTLHLPFGLAIPLLGLAILTLHLPFSLWLPLSLWLHNLVLRHLPLTLALTLSAWGPISVRNGRYRSWHLFTPHLRRW